MNDDRSWQRSDPASAGFRLEGSPFYWLTRVSGRYLLAMERQLKAIGMDVPRWRVLMILAEHEPTSISTLSESSVVKLATMTRIVQRMEADGLVATATSESDGRVTEVAMTAMGRIALGRVREKGSLVFRRAFADIAPKDAEALIVLLRQLFGNLDRIQPPDRSAAREPGDRSAAREKGK